MAALVDFLSVVLEMHLAMAGTASLGAAATRHRFARRGRRARAEVDLNIAE